MKNRISIVVMTVIAIVFAVNYFAADKKVVSKKPVEKSDFLPKDKKRNWCVC